MKKKMNPFFRILIFLLIIYSFIYFTKITGYYEGSIRRKVILTQSQKEKFEEDILNGKSVDEINYFYEKEDYSNIFTKSANYVANKLGVLVDNKAKNIWEYLKNLFIG